MKARRSFLVPATATLLLAACGPGEQAAIPASNIAPPPADTPDLLVNDTDPTSGLVIDQNWELVRANCSACHSVQLVTQNRGSRQNWLEMIRWMQESQGLWAFDEATETAILDYLEKNYAPSAIHRRVPLDPSLMPENPY